MAESHHCCCVHMLQTSIELYLLCSHSLGWSLHCNCNRVLVPATNLTSNIKGIVGVVHKAALEEIFFPVEETLILLLREGVSPTGGVLPAVEGAARHEAVWLGDDHRGAAFFAEEGRAGHAQADAHSAKRE